MRGRKAQSRGWLCEPPRCGSPSSGPAAGLRPVLPPAVALLSTQARPARPWALAAAASSGLALHTWGALHSALRVPETQGGCSSACVSFHEARLRLKVGSNADFAFQRQRWPHERPGSAREGGKARANDTETLCRQEVLVQLLGQTASGQSLLGQQKRKMRKTQASWPQPGSRASDAREWRGEA